MPLRGGPSYTGSEQTADGRVYTYENPSARLSFLQSARITVGPDGSYQVDCVVWSQEAVALTYRHHDGKGLDSRGNVQIFHKGEWAGYQQHSSAFLFDSPLDSIAFTIVICSERATHLPLLVTVSVLLSLLCALVWPVKAGKGELILSHRVFRFILFGGGILFHSLWVLRFFI